MGMTTILAVFAVVIVITISSLRGIAIQENESHVQTLLRALGSSWSSEVHAAPPQTLRELTETDGSLTKELNDSRWTGERLFRHGYLVQMVMQPSGLPTFVAWPSKHGRTGTRSFVWQPDGGLQAAEHQGQPWSGLENPPELETPSNP